MFIVYLVVVVIVIVTLIVIAMAFVIDRVITSVGALQLFLLLSLWL